jgi:hypothetical protein
VQSALAALRRAAIQADAAVNATQFREELAVCAVEAILSIPAPLGASDRFRGSSIHRSSTQGWDISEAEAGGHSALGWCQVALEAAATLRSAPFWEGLSGRRAAPDALFRLVARLCAATRAGVSCRRPRPEAAGVHAAAQRVLAALVADAAAAAAVTAARAGAGGELLQGLDDANAAAVAWLAARHLDFPTASGELGAAGGSSARAVAGLVAGLMAGGAGRAASQRRIAAAQRAAGTMSPAPTTPVRRGWGGGSPYSPAADVAALEEAGPAAAAAGLTCVELLAARCPPLASSLAHMLASLLASPAGRPANIGHAAAARAKMMQLRLQASSGDSAGTSTATGTPVPSSPQDMFPSSAPPPTLLLAHLSGLAKVRAAAADWALITSAWGALHGGGGGGCGKSVSGGRGRARGGGADDRARDGYGGDGGERPVPLTGTGDPCWIEGMHTSHPASRELIVTLRCRPPPASNAPNAGGAAGVLAGVLHVGLHGPCALAEGAAAVVAHLDGGVAVPRPEPLK